MDRNKIVILALILVIAALLVGILSVMPHMNKQDTNLTFKSNSTITEGDSIKIKLTDNNGTALANQTVNITITDKNKTSDYSVVTDENGTGTLKLDKDAGEYNVTASYGGDDNYSGCNATQALTIKEKVIETQSSSSYSQSKSSSDDYVYSPQSGKYIKKSGQWSKDSDGNKIYTYQGSDGVIYERYYDSKGKEINPNDYFK